MDCRFFEIIMWCVVVLVIKIHLAWSVYMTMTDVELELTIPNDRGKLPPSDHPILTLNVKDIHNDEMEHYNNHLRFSVNGSEYIQVYAPTGDVLLTHKFFAADTKGLGKVSATACVLDTITGDRDWASLQVNVLPLDNLDCDEILADICYWTAVTYRIEEETEATLLGPLASPYIMEMCPYYNINYTTTSDKIRFIPPSSELTFWSVGTTGPLSVPDKNMITANVTCNIETKGGRKKGNRREIKRELKISVIDIDNHPPEPQYREIVINMTAQHIKKGDSIRDASLVFTDKDNMDVNHYEAVVTGSEEDLLQPICNKHRDTRNGKNQTAIHCKFAVKKDRFFPISNYSFILQLNDTTMKNAKLNGVAQLPIYLNFSYAPAALTKINRPLKLYPDSIVKIFRTASPFARITQPDNLKGSSNFAISDVTNNNEIFDITKDEGIIYVHHFLGLKKAPEFVSLNVSWTKNNRREFDEIQVRIINEPNKTCGDMVDFHNWTFCSEYETANECLKASSCAISTGGSPSVATRAGPERCMWRGDKISSNITHLYSTCTPDTKTCPDGICDSLEQLYSLICPQDCIREVTWPARRNPNTGRGIDEASGVVVCSTTDRCTIFMPKKKTKDRKDSGKNKLKGGIKSATVTPPPQVEPNVSRQTGNFTTGKFLGVDIAKCGTICVLGIAGGTLFLGSAVALIVICWRLDRVNKAVREKNNEERHEMTQPLSISVHGNIPSEPIPLNFQMSSILADASSMNIINKYAPDPKWEFPRSQLIIEQTLGEGEFGRVLRAKALNISGQTNYTTVAVKTLKDDARESELNDLLSEYQLLKEVSHPNVIRLLGVCTSPGGPVYIIIEYAEYGSLRNYLRRSRHLKSENLKSSQSHLEDNEMDYDEPNLCKVTPKEILSFAWQICNGMAYLSDIKLVHRDLAARNVLLAADKICKISDFGLTRDIYEDNAYFKRSKGRVPVKWMAPESLADHVYTTKSDVWSFGVLIWELVTLGATPYPGIAVQNLFHLLRQGYRMERPENCSPGLYKIMTNCWHIEPERRPSFQELAGCWEKLLEDKMDYTDLSNNAIINREYFGSHLDDKQENLPKEHSDISPLNYLSRSQSYEKCGAIDKLLNNEVESITQNDINLIINAQGYETPVKVPRKGRTPTNEDPQDYTDMGGRCK